MTGILHSVLVPTIQKDVDRLERVQRSATEIRKRSLPSEKRMRVLDLFGFEKRRFG